MYLCSFSLHRITKAKWAASKGKLCWRCLFFSHGVLCEAGGEYLDGTFQKCHVDSAALYACVPFDVCVSPTFRSPMPRSVFLMWNLIAVTCTVWGVVVLSAGGRHLLEIFFGSGTLERKTYAVGSGQRLEHLPDVPHGTFACWSLQERQVPKLFDLCFCVCVLVRDATFRTFFFFVFSSLLADLCSCEHPCVFFLYHIPALLRCDGCNACLLFEHYILVTHEAHKCFWHKRARYFW